MYRILATLFAIVGMVVLGVVYIKLSNGDISVALKNPVLIVSLLFTFLPAFVLSLIAVKAERKLSVLVESMSNKDSTKETE